MHAEGSVPSGEDDARLVAENERLTAENGRLTAENERLTAVLARVEDDERQRDQYLALVSHELRTPLTVVLGLAQTLAARPELAVSDDGPEIIARIVRQGTRLHDMVELLLRSSARAADLSTARAAPTDISEILEEVVADRRSVEPARAVELELPESTESIAADPDALRIVFLNLVDNAFKHSPEDGPIEVLLEQGSGWSRVSVSDHGNGVDAADRERIFAPFTRLGELDSRRGGVGLGLFLVERLVVQMGGTVWVEDRDGHGARFVVELVHKNGAVPTELGVGAPA